MRSFLNGVCCIHTNVLWQFQPEPNWIKISFVRLIQYLNNCYVISLESISSCFSFLCLLTLWHYTIFLFSLSSIDYYYSYFLFLLSQMIGEKYVSCCCCWVATSRVYRVNGMVGVANHIVARRRSHSERYSTLFIIIIISISIEHCVFALPRSTIHFMRIHNMNCINPVAGDDAIDTAVKCTCTKYHLWAFTCSFSVAFLCDVLCWFAVRTKDLRLSNNKTPTPNGWSTADRRTAIRTT